MICKTIHQTYSEIDSIPDIYQRWRDTWLEHHPDWRYMFWSDHDIRKLIEENYNWFLSTYDNYELNIQRSDAGRYFILHKHGGLYVDLDIECYKNIENILGSDCVLFYDYPVSSSGFRGRIPTNIQTITNSIMYSAPMGRFMKTCMDNLNFHKHHTKHDNTTSVMLTTGPGYLTNTYNKYQLIYNDEIEIQSNMRFEPISKAERRASDFKYIPTEQTYGMHWNSCEWNKNSWIIKRVYIGYDKREATCYDVCKYSIKSNTESNVSVNPLNYRNIKQYDRPVDPKASTEFTYTRFMVPWLCEFKGWAMFCDCDFLFVDDISDIFKLASDEYAIMVCKHDYKPTNAIKMDGQEQSQYPRKNWSSLILWNCSHPSNRCLTPTVTNTQTGKFLHRFEWLRDEEIGTIPIEWNWLVGWYKEPDDGTPKGLHYTEGGPWFDDYKNCEYSSTWNKYYEMCSSR